MEKLLQVVEAAPQKMAELRHQLADELETRAKEPW